MGNRHMNLTVPLEYRGELTYTYFMRRWHGAYTMNMSSPQNTVAVYSILMKCQIFTVSSIVKF